MEVVNITVPITPQFYKFLQDLNDTGLYGFTIEDTLVRLAERQAQHLWENWDAEPPYGGGIGFKKQERKK